MDIKRLFSQIKIVGWADWDGCIVYDTGHSYHVSLLHYSTWKQRNFPCASWKHGIVTWSDSQ